MVVCVDDLLGGIFPVFGEHVIEHGSGDGEIELVEQVDRGETSPEDPLRES